EGGQVQGGQAIVAADLDQPGGDHGGGAAEQRLAGVVTQGDAAVASPGREQLDERGRARPDHEGGGDGEGDAPGDGGGQGPQRQEQEERVGAQDEDGRPGQEYLPPPQPVGQRPGRRRQHQQRQQGAGVGLQGVALGQGRLV